MEDLGPASLALAPAISNSSSETAQPSAPGNLCSLDEYLASDSLPEASNASKHSSGPHRVMLGARSSQNIVKLNHKCQVLGIDLPEFVFFGNTDGWKAKADFLGFVVETPGTFSSKQQAKEAVAGELLKQIEQVEAAGTSVSTKMGKKKKGANGEHGNVILPAKEPGPNYIGQLIEFRRSTDDPEPVYTEYAVGNLYACTLAIHGVNGTFGSKDQCFTSKKAARQNAAQCAVDHFKATGVWPDGSTDVGGIKKKKKAPEAAQPPPTPSAKSPRSPTLNSSPRAAGKSYSAQVAELAKELCLGTAEYIFFGQGDHNFHCVCCEFKNCVEFPKPFAEVRHVFGKKAAKEECARLTLSYLVDLKEARLKKMMHVLEGDDGAASTEGEGVVDLEKMVDSLTENDAGTFAELDNRLKQIKKDGRTENDGAASAESEDVAEQKRMIRELLENGSTASADEFEDAVERA